MCSVIKRNPNGDILTANSQSAQPSAKLYEINTHQECVKTKSELKKSTFHHEENCSGGPFGRICNQCHRTDFILLTSDICTVSNADFVNC